jgi:sec-independent protein translocase protein TatA
MLTYIMPNLPATLAIMDFLGGSEMLLIFFLILMLFGGQKMPELARGLGKAIREFKKATAGVEEEIKKALETPAESEKPKLENKPVSPATNPLVVPPPEK